MPAPRARACRRRLSPAFSHGAARSSPRGPPSRGMYGARRRRAGQEEGKGEAGEGRTCPPLPCSGAPRLPRCSAAAPSRLPSRACCTIRAFFLPRAPPAACFCRRGGMDVSIFYLHLRQRRADRSPLFLRSGRIHGGTRLYAAGSMLAPALARQAPLPPPAGVRSSSRICCLLAAYFQRAYENRKNTRALYLPGARTYLSWRRAAFPVSYLHRALLASASSFFFVQQRERLVYLQHQDLSVIGVLLASPASRRIWQHPCHFSHKLISS